MTRTAIPLEEYLERLAFGDSPPPSFYYSFRAPPDEPSTSKRYQAWHADHDAHQGKWAWINEARESAWATICRRAGEGWLEIHAFAYVQKDDPQATWYPGALAKTVSERVPREFFLRPVKLGLGGPEGRSFLYYAERKNGTIFNAPWANPVVIVDDADGSTPGVPSHRPPDALKRALAVLKALPEDELRGKKAALDRAVNERLTAQGKPAVSADTIRRARKLLLSGGDA